MYELIRKYRESLLEKITDKEQLKAVLEYMESVAGSTNLSEVSYSVQDAIDGLNNRLNILNHENIQENIQ
jgi:hypothetical protein